MGVIIRNGIEYSGAGMGGGSCDCDEIVYLTQEEYDALPESKESNDVEYRITNANTHINAARDWAYDNSESGLEAETVQDAIDEVDEKVNTLNNNLIASDNLKFQFATDGEGNYGYLGADDSFIPFKSGASSKLLFIGGENSYVSNASTKTFSTVKYIDNSCVELINSNTGLKIKTDMKILIYLKVTNATSSNSYAGPVGYCFLNGTSILSASSTKGAYSYGIAQRYISVNESDVITVGTTTNDGYNTIQLLVYSFDYDEKFEQFNNSYLFNGIE